VTDTPTPTVTITPTPTPSTTWTIQIQEQTTHSAANTGFTSTSQGMGKVVTFVESTGNTTGVDGTTSVDAPQSWNWSVQDDPNQTPDGLCSGSGTADTTGGGALLKPEGNQLGVIISMYYELGFCSPTDSLASAFVIAPTTDAPVLIAPIDGATVTTTVVSAVLGPGNTVSTTYTITLHLGTQ
jgi:hypothetical protein